MLIISTIIFLAMYLVSRAINVKLQKKLESLQIIYQEDVEDVIDECLDSQEHDLEAFLMVKLGGFIKTNFGENCYVEIDRGEIISNGVEVLLARYNKTSYIIIAKCKRCNKAIYCTSPEILSLPINIESFLPYYGELKELGYRNLQLESLYDKPIEINSI